GEYATVLQFRHTDSTEREIQRHVEGKCLPQGLCPRAAVATAVGDPVCSGASSGWRGSHMSTTEALTGPGFLARERTIARPGFSRWLVPPAALAIHLCIGMAYGFSVFTFPLTNALGITTPIKCAADVGLIGRLFTTSCDWQVADLQVMPILFFIFLGSSAALWGAWAERSGPRKTGLVA